jgi:aminoglycoside phosphotransferase (APT) family kinase protein
VSDPRVYPLIPVSRDELEQIVGGPIVELARVDGGLTNTLHRVVLADGGVVVVRHHAGGAQPFRDELATIERLAGRLPVPELVRADEARHAIVYRWIEGITLDDCRRSEPPAAFASLAGPLGRLLAWLARCEPRDGERWNVAPLLALARLQLLEGRARARLGAPLADSLAAALDGEAEHLAWGTPCLSHGDIGGRNVLVRRIERDRWRIAGVIDWEAAASASPLVDLGALFRYANRYDAAFIDAFERGYREAGGVLPRGWLRTARLLDATALVDVLDEPRELPGVFADCRILVAKLAVEYRAAA